MFIRIVKMSIDKDKIEEFLSNFHQNKEKIRNFQGCQFLELYQDKNDDNIFFTYSYWNTEEDLENYRKSDFFQNVWSKTKILFNENPQAWSVNKIVSLK
ncbi:MAG: antibiotic biosynthesis monooxygenase [Flavobacteriaceae bacterium]|nr:antibiotic biosynthesis monooxygenase [Flavobacteriaceae bacterium]